MSENTVSNKICDCKQGFTEDNIAYEFGKENDLKKCNGCNHLSFDD
jgi:hypothetical protein